jgi:putative DNA primase/helicase
MNTQKLRAHKEYEKIFYDALEQAQKFASIADISIKQAVSAALSQAELITGVDFSYWKESLENESCENPASDNVIDRLKYNFEQQKMPYCGAPTIKEFLTEFRNKLVWDLIPREFLYDLYLSWFNQHNQGHKPAGRNKFVRKFELMIQNDSEFEWKVVRNPHFTLDRIAKPEPLILEYNLTNWKNKYGRNAAEICTPTVSDRYRGILRVREKCVV